MGLFGITFRYVWFVVPIGGFFLGKYLDDQETLRMISYRDQSELYGMDNKANNPSWP